MQGSGCRVWLCHRSFEGEVTVGRCLETLDDDIVLGDMCEHDGNGYPWLTLFLEEKKAETLPAVTDNTIVVFCKISHLQFDELDYLGVVVIDKNERMLVLANQLMNLAELRIGTASSFFKEHGQTLKEISRLFASIEQVNYLFMLL